MALLLKSNRKLWGGAIAAVAGTVFAGVPIVLAQQSIPREKGESVRFEPATAPVPVPATTPPGEDPTRRQEWNRANGYAVTVDVTERAAEAEREKAIHDLLAQYAKSERSEGERAEFTDKIAEIVGKEFDARQKMRDKELKELEKEIAGLRKLHDKRSSQKEAIVRDRSRQLILEAEGMGWSDQRLSPRPPAVLHTPTPESAER